MSEAKQGVALANAVLRSQCFKDKVSEKARSFTTTGDTGEQVLEKMTHSGGTFQITFFTGTWLQNHWSKTIGWDNPEDPHNVHMNRSFVQSAWWVANNLVHEAAHAYGYPTVPT